MSITRLFNFLRLTTYTMMMPKNCLILPVSVGNNILSIISFININSTHLQYFFECRVRIAHPTWLDNVANHQRQEAERSGTFYFPC